MAKSVLRDKEEIMLSKTLKMVKYTYLYIDGYDAGRPREPEDMPRKRGWKITTIDRTIIRDNGCHLWKYIVIMQRDKRN